MIPKSEWKTWKPTPEMIRAAETVFLAMAHTETIRPIVTEYKTRILAEMQAPLAACWADHRAGLPAVILRPFDSYLMEDADFQAYHARCKQERDKAGLHVDNDDFCPLCVAEHLQTQAEHALIDIMVPVTGITFDQLMCSGDALKNLKKYLDLTLRMMAPRVHTGPEIMKRVA